MKIEDRFMPDNVRGHFVETKMEDKQPKDFSHIKIGQWVQSLVTDTDYGRQINKWYQRINCNDMSLKFCFVNDNSTEQCSINPNFWDLSDIRDTNPDQPVETHEDTPPITKRNIVDVLEYNGVARDMVNVGGNGIEIRSGNVFTSFSFKNPIWLQHLELEIGKLTPIPKPKFDFVKYLLDNGWTSNNHNSACISSKRKTMMIVIKDYKFHHYDNSKQLYDCSEYNAKILVEMSNLGEKFQVSKELS